MLGEFFERLAVKDRRGVHEYVDTAHGANHFDDHPLDLGDPFEVCRKRQRLSPLPRDLCHQIFGLSARIAVMDRDSRAARGEIQRYCPADPASRSGDKRNLPFKFHQGFARKAATDKPITNLRSREAGRDCPNGPSCGRLRGRLSDAPEDRGRRSGRAPYDVRTRPESAMPCSQLSRRRRGSNCRAARRSRAPSPPIFETRARIRTYAPCSWIPASLSWRQNSAAEPSSAGTSSSVLTSRFVIPNP